MGRAAFLAVFLLFSLHSDFGRFQRAENTHNENQKLELIFLHYLDSNVGSVSSAFTAFSFQKRILLRQLSTCKYWSNFQYFLFFQHCEHFLHLCVQKVVEAVLEEEVQEDGGNVGLSHSLVHRRVVCGQQCRDQPSAIGQ